jgi:hypothetical protein
MSERIKIRFRLNNSQIGGELVWAEKIDEVRYRLLNIPYYAEGYAEGDIVHCIETNNQIEVIAIEEDSGNGTLRLIFADSQRPEAQTVLDNSRQLAVFMSELPLVLWLSMSRPIWKSLFRK